MANEQLEWVTTTMQERLEKGDMPRIGLTVRGHRFTYVERNGTIQIRLFTYDKSRPKAGSGGSQTPA
jgi:hypothetical protein